MAGRRADRAVAELERAVEAYSRDREREAVRILRPLRDMAPESAGVRELLGLSLYRSGSYEAAAEELEAFARISGSVEQHPVLMDCYRAQGRHRLVAERWEELGAMSPSSELVTEGRIVLAGDLADQGRIQDALALLRRRADGVRQPREQHLRLWYALADLEERAGNVPRARELFERVRARDATYADVAERLATL